MFMDYILEQCLYNCLTLETCFNVTEIFYTSVTWLCALLFMFMIFLYLFQHMKCID